MNISVIGDQYIIFKNEMLTIYLELSDEYLNISVTSHTERQIYYVLVDNYSHLHVTNGQELYRWIVECAEKQHIRIDHTRTLMVLFTWDDDYVERIEIPAILHLCKSLSI